MANSSPKLIQTWWQVTLRVASIYVALTSLGFMIWKSTGDDAGTQLVGFVLAALVLVVGAIVAFCHRNVEAGVLALIFVTWALVSAWSVLSRLARAA